MDTTKNNDYFLTQQHRFGFDNRDVVSITFYWPTNALNCIKLKG